MMKIQRVEQIIIRKSHPKFKIIDQQCYHAKNLYNEANYILRQEFIQNKNYISYQQMHSDMKTNENFKLCMSQPANCVLRVLDKNWKSFFVAIKDWNDTIGNVDVWVDLFKLDLFQEDLAMLWRLYMR